MKDKLGIETQKFPGNIMDEPSLSDAEKVVLYQLQYKFRLSKEASTESNKTIGIRANKSQDRANGILASLDKKGMIYRIKDPREKTGRRIEPTPITISLITKPFINWYLDRVGKFAYPPMTKEQLEVVVGQKDLEKILPYLIEKKWIED